MDAFTYFTMILYREYIRSANGTEKKSKFSNFLALLKLFVRLYKFRS